MKKINVLKINNQENRKNIDLQLKPSTELKCTLKINFFNTWMYQSDISIFKIMEEPKMFRIML